LCPHSIRLVTHGYEDIYGITMQDAKIFQSVISPKGDKNQTFAAIATKVGILLANQLQSSGSIFSCVSFPSFFAFQEGMWDTQISALPSSPTVSARYCDRLHTLAAGLVWVS